MPEPTIRASDQERAEVADQLSENASQGRLTLAELEERISAAHEATTRAQLAQLTTDLPVGMAATTPDAPVPRLPVTRRIAAVMGGTTLKGRWRPDREVNVIAVMGGHDVDLREAELDYDEITITVYSVLGASGVYVPDTVNLRVTDVSVMGTNEELGSVGRPRPGAPTVNVRLVSVLGTGEVWRMPEETNGMSLRRARKIAKRAGTDQR